MHSRSMSTTQRRRFWKGHVNGWRNSGQSRKHYCQEHGLKVSTFRYWCSRLPQLSPKPRAETPPKEHSTGGRLRMVPISREAEKDETPDKTPIQVQFGEFVITVSNTVNEANLRAVIRALRSC